MNRMKLPSSPAVFFLSAAIYIFAGSADVSALNPGQPVKGAGILQSKKSNAVSLFVQHSRSSKELSTSGRFEAALGWVSYDVSPRLLMLNIYKLTRTTPSSTPTEKLVYSGAMQRNPSVLYVVPEGQQDGATFSTELGDVTRVAGTLSGEYRAEAVAYVVPGTFQWDGKSTPPAQYEVGGADVVFTAASSVNLVPVSDVRGGITMGSEVAVSRGATKAQIAALAARNLSERNAMWPLVTQYFAKQTQSVPGAPTREPWSFSLVAAAINVGTGATGINLEKGQIYTADRPRIEREIAALIKSCNKTITMPGGVITIRTWGDITFTDL